MKRSGAEEEEEDNLLKDILGSDDDSTFPVERPPQPQQQEVMHHQEHPPAKRRADESWERGGRWEGPRGQHHRRSPSPSPRTARPYPPPEPGYQRSRPRSPGPPRGYYSPPRYPQQDPALFRQRGRGYPPPPRGHYPPPAHQPYPYEQDPYYSKQHHPPQQHRRHDWYDNEAVDRGHGYGYRAEEDYARGRNPPAASPPADYGSRPYRGEPRYPHQRDPAFYPRDTPVGEDEAVRPKSAPDTQSRQVYSAPPPSQPAQPSQQAQSQPTTKSEDGETKHPAKITPIVFDLEESKGPKRTAKTPQPRPEEPRPEPKHQIQQIQVKPAEVIRYFVARCNYYDMLVKSKWEGSWKTPSYIVNPIEEALGSCDQAWLLFSVHGSQYYQGIAQVDRSRPIEHPSGRMKLAKLPIKWIIIADVPYGALPSIPGMMSADGGGLRETFEIPAHFGRDLLPIFQKFRAMDATL